MGGLLVSTIPVYSGTVYVSATWLAELTVLTFLFGLRLQTQPHCPRQLPNLFMLKKNRMPNKLNTHTNTY
jgi:hypothetical protein